MTGHSRVRGETQLRLIHAKGERPPACQAPTGAGSWASAKRGVAPPSLTTHSATQVATDDLTQGPDSMLVGDAPKPLLVSELLVDSVLYSGAIAGVR